MATQILPQVLVFQEFQSVPTAITQPLRAFVFGPDYNVQKFTAANKANHSPCRYVGPKDC